MRSEFSGKWGQCKVKKKEIGIYISPYLVREKYGNIQVIVYMMIFTLE